MKRYEGFSPVRNSRKSLAPGGYVAKVMRAEEVSFANGPALRVSFDIAEGPQAGFFADEYRNNTFENKFWRGTHYLTLPAGDGTDRDGWAVNAMNNFIAVLQESNPGYRWDWAPVERGDYAQLKGKLMGVLFGNVEWEKNGKTGWNSRCRAIIPAEDVRDGHFQIPEDRPLARRPVRDVGSPAPAAGGLSASDDDLPF